MPNPASDAAQTAAHLARNAVECLPERALRDRLEKAAAEDRPLRIKLGLDPTAPDIHLGHTVVLQKLREFQDAGHLVVLIIGDYTARVGDPSGRSATRPVLSGEEIDAHARTYIDQARKVLLTDPQHFELRHNSEWLDMPMEDLFALVRTVTVAQLLERDDFARRWAAREPISLLEMLYPILQGYDSVAVRADVELGGTDQTFNLMMGRNVQSAYGQPQQIVLTMPILPGTDGEKKMSKSLANHIGVTEPAEEIYGKTMSIPDAALESWYTLLLGEDPPLAGSDRSDPYSAKRALARALADRFAGEGSGAAGEEHFDRLFKAHDIPEDVPEHTLAPADGEVHLPAVIADAFGISRSEARRLLGSGGVKLAGEPVADLDLPVERVDGVVLQLGKRRFVRLRTG